PDRQVHKGGYTAGCESDVCARQPDGGDYRVCRRASGSGCRAARGWTVKRANFSFVAFALVLLFGGQLWAQSPTWQQIPIPKLPEFHPPQPKRIELANGMVVFLQEDHELPTIDGTARIRGGERS